MTVQMDWDTLDALTSGTTAEYDDLVERHKPKKTTDDCYTPPEVYDAVKEWFFREYGIPEDRPIVRPFYPGGDYRAEDYPEGCIVLDNPPFSIMSEICGFYLSKGIDFVLFNQDKTVFQCFNRWDVSAVIPGCQIVYDNGASIGTAFVHNLDGPRVRTAPDLGKRIKKVNRPYKGLAHIDMPINVLNGARLSTYASRGVDVRIPWGGVRLHPCAGLHASRWQDHLWRRHPDIRPGRIQDGRGEDKGREKMPGGGETGDGDQTHL